MKRLLILWALLTIFISGATLVHAREEARDITPGTTIYGSGYESFWFLTDDDMLGIWSGWDAGFTIESPEDIGSIYLMFDYSYGTYTISDPDTGTSVQVKREYLHQFLDLTELLGYAPNKVTFSFDSGRVMLCELEVYSPGQPPAHVQQWQAPWEGNTDLLLFCTHGDDDHLYFAGLLPLYAGEKKLNVQVVYMTDHRNETYARTHEMLNGLWSVGVRAYPVFGWFADFITYDKTRAYEIYEEDYKTTWAMLQSFVVEQLRRFKPQVAVGHDIYGEYGHAMHKIYTELLIGALPLIGDANSFPKSAEKWGTWELPKLYLHLYWNNTMVMDYDQPLDSFDGLTAFQVSQQLGFPCHKSQQWDKFVNWLYGVDNEITRADQIELYNPAYFGLYRTQVGDDELKNDLMEHITPHAYVRRRAAAEEAFRALPTPDIPEETVVEVPEEPTRITEPTEPEVIPSTVTTTAKRPLWIDLSANGLILVVAVTLLTVGIVKIKKRSK